MRNGGWKMPTSEQSVVRNESMIQNIIYSLMEILLGEMAFSSTLRPCWAEKKEPIEKDKVWAFIPKKREFKYSYQCKLYLVSDLQIPLVRKIKRYSLTLIGCQCLFPSKLYSTKKWKLGRNEGMEGKIFWYLYIRFIVKV